MILVVRRHDNKEIAIVKKLVSLESNVYVWCEGWPGKHVMDQDCSFVHLSQKQMPVVEYLVKNPGDTIRQAAKELKRTYIEVFRVVNALDLTVKPERKERSARSATSCINAAFVF